MTQKQAIDIICKCAKLYQRFLENYQGVFVYRDSDNHSQYTEVQFKSHNFLHFTGVNLRIGLNSNTFYRYALNNRLSEKEDIRLLIPKPAGKIYAIFKKKIGDVCYT